ncbi:hypothetical protein FJZ36_08645 [Candidatus Poribacteria bacterium]|nr:hypothetical protein [Candidatus Poribacteria bacterium]
MSNPRRRYRHLQARTKRDDPGDPAAAERARRALADLVEEVVEVPSYRPHTEHVDPARTWMRVARWAAGAVALAAVLFGVVYAALAVHGRSERLREERTRAERRRVVLSQVRSELQAHVAVLRDQTVALSTFEQAVRAWQHVPPPELVTEFSSQSWDTVSRDPLVYEDASLYDAIVAFYASLPGIAAQTQDYLQQASRWRAATRGYTSDSLAKSRDKRTIVRIREIDNDFADATRAFSERIALQRDAGEELLIKLATFDRSEP